MSKIICYYAGGCGNRFEYYLRTNTCFQEVGLAHYSIHSIKTTTEEERKVRDMTYDTEVLGSEPYYQTHCFTSSLLREKFPNSSIYKIKNDYQLSLFRSWTLLKGMLTNSFEADVDSAFQYISHVEAYYLKHPIDWDCDFLIETTPTEFVSSMHKEMNRYEYTLAWTLAWDSFNTHGADAPIIDIARTYNEQI